MEAPYLPELAAVVAAGCSITLPTICLNLSHMGRVPGRTRPYSLGFASAAEILRPLPGKPDPP